MTLGLLPVSIFSLTCRKMNMILKNVTSIVPNPGVSNLNLRVSVGAGFSSSQFDLELDIVLILGENKIAVSYFSDTCKAIPSLK